MLLRSSRVAELLTKEALVGKALQLAGKRTLGFAGRHWKGVAGTGLVAATAAPMVAQGARSSEIGLTQPWLQASNARAVAPVPKFK
jgi:hypothetical protein